MQSGLAVISGHWDNKFLGNGRPEWSLKDRRSQHALVSFPGFSVLWKELDDVTSSAGRRTWFYTEQELSDPVLVQSHLRKKIM